MVVPAVSRSQRLVPVVGLLVVAPFSAELLSAYLGLFIDPVGLLVQLAIALPLYGSAALLVREITRRVGRGWPTMALLATAFGLVQAGLIDQGLFNPHYIDDPSWFADRKLTLIPGLDLSVSYLVTFVGGHLLWSFGAPIAVVEAAAARRDGPWLGRVGLTVTAAVYLLAAAFLVAEHTAGRQFVVSSLQLSVTVAVVVALVVGAFALPHRSAWATRSVSGRVPPPGLLGLAAVVACGVHALAPPTWLGVVMSVAALGLVAGSALAWSRRAGWRQTHVLAVGAAPLVTNVLIAFTVTPDGASGSVAKYVSNIVLLVALSAGLAWAWRRT